MICLVGGLPGSGKSYFAEKLAKKISALYLNSDQIRMELFPVRHYTEEEKQQVYAEMFRRMTETMHSNHVVIDATFYKEGLRQFFLQAIRKTKIPAIVFYIHASEELTRKRTSGKRVYSEADFDVYLKMKKVFEPFTGTFLSLESLDNNIDEMLQSALVYIDRYAKI